LTFKEQIRADIDNVFMNTDEFAAEHTVNGKKMPVTVDNNELIERAKKAKSNMDGIYTKTTLIYVKAKDFGPLPAVGAALNLDGKTYRVTDAMNEDGLFSIHLEANRS
jgi:hypothetical protein